MTRAVFLDRDGVINRNVFYSDTGEFESPRTSSDFELHANVMEALRLMRDAGYDLFLVSNQPNVAKGKSTLEDLREAHAKLEAALRESGIAFKEFYYCYHHPDSKLQPYGGSCECRKPSPYFLLQAQKNYEVDLEHSWMIGDRATDIACGIAAGVKTIRILPDHPGKDIKDEKPQAVHVAKDLFDAANWLVSAN